MSMAIGDATLSVLRNDKLQGNAAKVGSKLLTGLLTLKKRHCAIGAVTGAGLNVGVELVRKGAEPDEMAAKVLVQK